MNTLSKLNTPICVCTTPPTTTYREKIDGRTHLTKALLVLFLSLLFTAASFYPLHKDSRAEVSLHSSVQNAYASVSPAGAGHEAHTLFGWGWNMFGQLGNGSSLIYLDDDELEPIAIPLTAEMIAAGVSSWSQVHLFTHGETSFAKTPNGEMFMWGALTPDPNFAAAATDQPLPVRIEPTAAMIAAGITNWNHADIFPLRSRTFVLAPNGTLFGWGVNNVGQLGDGTTTNRPTPVSIDPPTGHSNWSGVEIHYIQGGALAHFPNGDIFTWGGSANLGQLGDGTTVNRNRPGIVDPTPAMITAGITDWSGAEIFSDVFQTWVRFPNGIMVAWGQGTGGLLEDDTWIISNRPNIKTPTSEMIAAGITNWNYAEVLTGARVNFVLAPNGELFSWGSNWYGTLGDGTRVTRNVPKAIPIPQAMANAGFTSWAGVYLSVGNLHTFALFPPPAWLTKNLQVPLRAPMPSNKSFNFTLEPIEIPLTNNPPIMYSSTVPIPTSLFPSISFTGDETLTSIGSGLSETSRSLNIRPIFNSLLASNAFPRPGIYTWVIREVPSDPRDPFMAYSTASYHLKLRVINNPYFDPNLAENASNRRLVICPDNALEMWRVDPDTFGGVHDYIPYPEVDISGVKVRYLRFTNRYLATDDLSVSKTVTGEFADLSTSFDFVLTLTGIANINNDTQVVANVVQRPGNTVVRQVNVNLPQNYNESVETSFSLAHNQVLQIPGLVIGNTFQLREIVPTPVWQASAYVYSANNRVATYADFLPGQDLITAGTYSIQSAATAPPANTSPNRVDVTNDHRGATPTGFSTPAAPLGLLAVGVLALLTLKRRKFVEKEILRL